MFEWFSAWTVWHWLVLGFALLIAEVILPGIFLLWWGLAAIVIAGVMALTSFSLSTLGIMYAVLSLIFSLVWWKYQHGKDQKDQKKSVLNRRDHAMIGTHGTVEEMTSGDIGRGHFGDTTWRIQGDHLAVGDAIEVIGVQGITLYVRKLG